MYPLQLLYLASERHMEDDEIQIVHHRQPKLASLQTAFENLNAL